MTAYAKYCVKTVLVAVLLSPLVLGIAMMVLTMVFDMLSWSLPGDYGLVALAAGGVVLALVPLWFAWSRQAPSAQPWLAVLLPVALPPAVALVGWMVTYAVGAERATLSQPWAFLGYFGLIAVAALVGEAWLVPYALVILLLGSVGAFVWGRSRRVPLPAGKSGLVGVLVGSLVLSASPAALAGFTGWYEDSLKVADEVDLSRYRPWAPGNLLAVPPTAPGLQLVGDFPRLDGATALYPVYAAVGQAVYVRPSGQDDEAANAFADTYLACNRTSEAYDRLIAGSADVIFVAEPSQGHLARAKQAGVELRLTPLGREAFTFFVNAGNTVTGLTTDQLRDIYAGRVTNWKQVGGPDEPITAYQRPEDSGSQTTMLAKVMKDTPMMEAPQKEIASGMGTVLREVADYRNVSSAIGYTFRWYATVMDPNPGIRLLAIDGVEATPDNIRNGSYPLTSEFYAVTAGPPTPSAGRLIDWMTSPEGQSFIDRIGYVPR